MRLRELDVAGRKCGVEVYSVEDALDYIKSLEGSWE
jgi:hypothetical protein